MVSQHPSYTPCQKCQRSRLRLPNQPKKQYWNTSARTQVTPTRRYRKYSALRGRNNELPVPPYRRLRSSLLVMLWSFCARSGKDKCDDTKNYHKYTCYCKNCIKI